jgi:prophage regulatory protein
MAAKKGNTQAPGPAHKAAEASCSPVSRAHSSADSAKSDPQPVSRSKIVRIKDLIERLGVSRSTIWRWERSKLLPPRRQIGPNVVGWTDDEIELFIRSRPTPGSDGTVNNGPSDDRP